MPDLSFNQSAHIIDMSINFIQIVATFVPIPEKYHKDPFSRYSMIMGPAPLLFKSLHFSPVFILMNDTWQANDPTVKNKSNSFSSFFCL